SGDVQDDDLRAVEAGWDPRHSRSDDLRRHPHADRLARRQPSRSAQARARRTALIDGGAPRTFQRNAGATSLINRSRSGRGSLVKIIDGAKIMATPAARIRPSLSRTSLTEPASNRSRTIDSG